MKRYALVCVLALVVAFGTITVSHAMESAPRLDKGATEHHWGGRRSHRGGRGWRGVRGGRHWGGGYSRHGYYYYN